MNQYFLKIKIALLFLLSFLVIGIIFNNCSAPEEKSSKDNRVGSGGGGGGTTPIDYNAMVSITGGTYFQTDGIEGFNHNISNFRIAKYEVTYELWLTVYIWAVANGYNIANAGVMGNSAGGTDKQPVTTISWRDAIVWCNAYSEKSGLTPVYRNNLSNAVIKDSRASNAIECDNAICKWNDNGYRLPSEGEWQFVASNKGLTPYNYASGATTFWNNVADINPTNGVVDGKDANDLVAVYGYYWKVGWAATGVTKTADVGTKKANALGIFDMSGNVWEWCWDWYDSYPLVLEWNYRGPIIIDTDRVIRGGNWNWDSSELQVGIRKFSGPSNKSEFDGFRVARSN